MAEHLMNDDGENRAVRCFLMQYGTPGLTVGAMKRHMDRCGFPFRPAWVDESYDNAHITKGGAQHWLRHLFALEKGNAGATAGHPFGCEPGPQECPCPECSLVRNNERADADGVTPVDGGQPFDFHWLVELRPAFEGHPHFDATYYAGWIDGFEAAKTKDPMEAVRFTSKDHAERMAKRLGFTLSCVWTAVEHGFAAGVAIPDERQPALPRDLDRTVPRSEGVAAGVSVPINQPKR